MNSSGTPEQLGASSFCPSCGNQFDLDECADPLSTCLICANGHRFFIMPSCSLAADTAKAKVAKFPEISDLPPAGVASFWLSDSRARSILNQQLAQLLRAFLESRRVLDEALFSFCPRCKRDLVEEEAGDIWIQALRCGNGHLWALRGGRFYSVMENTRLELHAENSDMVVGRLIAAWLKGDPGLETNLHESVRRVLLSSPLAPRSTSPGNS